MCGIAGFINKNRRNFRDDIKAMCDVMKDRGPDAEGIWAEEDASVVLGHRRLSILDLSTGGAQPMMSRNQRFVMSYNGEIYNFSDIRDELSACNHIKFRGTSDTEVLLEAFASWGVDQTLTKVVGMYAIALYDRKEKKLYLIRDRMGEKPLYYGFVNGNFVFASTLNAIGTWKEFEQKIDKSVLKLYLQYGYIPAPYSIYEGIYKLEAGCYLTIKPPFDRYEKNVYWDIEKIAVKGQNHKFEGSFEEASDVLESLIKKSIQRQMVADVPVGAFLSGGTDSTAVVAIAQSLSSQKLKTFTIGFSNDAFNEANYAAESAKILGTDHIELYITDEDARKVIPSIPSFYGEPFADSSQIPTYLVSKLAREQVTVSLSGDGGDELFCGYHAYNFVPSIYHKLSKIPYGLRKQLYSVIGKGLFKNNRRVQTREGILLATSTVDMYRRLSPSRMIDVLVLDSGSIDDDRWLSYSEGTLNTVQDDLMCMDMIQYLPDDILVKVDRSAMAVSLESRVPFLDRDIVEFAWQLPIEFKKSNGINKKILKNILYQYIPESVMERPKKGFAVPIIEWLQGPLKEWAEGLLAENRIRKQGILDAHAVDQIWNSFLKCGAYADLVWNLVIFQTWLENI